MRGFPIEIHNLKFGCRMQGRPCDRPSDSLRLVVGSLDVFPVSKNERT